MNAKHCEKGRRISLNTARLRNDFVQVARLATRDGIPGERAQRRLPAAKESYERTRDGLAQHVETCDECADLAAVNS